MSCDVTGSTDVDAEHAILLLLRGRDRPTCRWALLVLLLAAEDADATAEEAARCLPARWVARRNMLVFGQQSMNESM